VLCCAAGVLQQEEAAKELQELMQLGLACCGQHVGWNGWAGTHGNDKLTQGMAGLGCKTEK